MAEKCFHPSIEGAQHGAKSLADFLDYAKASGAAGAQPSNYMLTDGAKLKKASEIKDAFASRGMTLDGISAHPPFPAGRRRAQIGGGNREMERELSVAPARSGR
jgi:sugar phosphate isomerase/epimerase